jgi:hypothetical protein
LRIVKTGLYILAGIVLVLGLIAGISLLSGAERTVMNMLLPFQLMGSPAVQNMITPLLRALFINLGIAIIVLTLIFSGLLYAVGRLIGHILHLEERIVRLETRS